LLGWGTAFVVGLVIVAAIGWRIYGDGLQPGFFLPDDMNVVARGRVLYAENCAACHGADRRGEPDWQTAKSDGRMPAPPHDGSGHTWQHSDLALLEVVKFGPGVAAGRKDAASDMPAFGDRLSDEEIIAIYSFIKSRWTIDIRKRHDEANRKAGCWRAPDS